MTNFKAAFEALRQWYTANAVTLRARYYPLTGANYRVYRQQKQVLRERVDRRLEELKRRAEGKP
jgi:hypothetical protein